MSADFNCLKPEIRAFIMIRILRRLEKIFHISFDINIIYAYFAYMSDK